MISIPRTGYFVYGDRIIDPDGMTVPIMVWPSGTRYVRMVVNNCTIDRSVKHLVSTALREQTRRKRDKRFRELQAIVERADRVVFRRRLTWRG